jgi:hypothetical protein
MVRRCLTHRRRDCIVREGNMNPLRLLALLAVSGGLPAFAGEAPTLADDSPFLPSATAKNQGTAVSADGLELRGVMSGSSGYLYYVYDPVKKHGVWAGSNDTEYLFKIVADDGKEGRLEVKMNDGRILHLKLREAKILSGGGNSPAILVPSPGRAPGGLTETQAAWREEARRRMAENAASN